MDEETRLRAKKLLKKLKKYVEKLKKQNFRMTYGDVTKGMNHYIAEHFCEYGDFVASLSYTSKRPCIHICVDTLIDGKWYSEEVVAWN